MKRLVSLFKLRSDKSPESLTSLDKKIETDLMEQAEEAKHRGNQFLTSGNPVEAIKCYREAISLMPNFAEAYVNLGAALRASGKYLEAKDELLRAVALKPSLWQAYFQLGQLHEDLEEPEESVANYRTTLEIKPDFQECHARLGQSLAMLKNWKDAVTEFELANLPEDAFHLQHGYFAGALSYMGRHIEALHHCQIAISKNKTIFLYRLLGDIYGHLAMHQEAEEAFRCALALDPNYPIANTGYAYMLLTRGDYHDGFRYYEKRFWLDEIKNEWRVIGIDKYWQGQDITNGRILLIPEQGFGDHLMMLRYVPLLKKIKRASKVTVFTTKPLLRIFQNVPEIDLATDNSSILNPNDFDWYCTPMTLPFAFKTELNSIPESPYLSIAAQHRNKWLQRVSGLTGLKVGITWAGMAGRADDDIRSIPLEKVRPLFSVPGISWVSLQKEQNQDKIANADLPLHDWMNESEDFLDTAGLMECLDLIITVDTSIVHLAGAIGRPTWLMNRYNTEWRWLTEREDSPWYSTVKIFRQTDPKDWGTTIEVIANELRRKTNSAVVQ